MVRVIEAYDVQIGVAKYYEYFGLSTDAKPTDDSIATGSVFIEVNTGNAYLYDEVSKTWNKVSGSSDQDPESIGPAL